jgi:hypothetical protein
MQERSHDAMDDDDYADAEFTHTSHTRSPSLTVEGKMLSFEARYVRGRRSGNFSLYGDCHSATPIFTVSDPLDIRNPELQK